MPKAKTIPPKTSREKGQRSQDLPEFYFNRILPAWRNPDYLMGDIWRAVVHQQPIAVDCRDTLISKILSFDWQIDARDSTRRDELKEDIEYYTKFFEDTGKYDYTQIIEWIGKDALDLPFGAAAELGYTNDDPTKRLLWIELLDAVTLFPTLNKDWPVGQTIREQALRTIYFPKYAINRLYMSPRTELKREGWGMAPPEKVFLAVQLLNRGDVYYANLLLDTPEAGILDLGNIAKDSAEEWVKAWGDMLGGVDPFKVPVLYEHDMHAKFISFTRSPTELMYDKAIFKYMVLVTSAYGLSPSDLGFGSTASGGDTLAGSIRQERQTRSTGVAIVAKKFKFWFNRMLPESLQFKFIDLDDEVSVALGRARLSNATALNLLVTSGMIDRSEGRRQMIADGLISISIPEEPPSTAIPQNGTAPERPSTLGNPVPVSGGGQGEVRQSIFETELEKLSAVDDVRLRRLIRSAVEPLFVETQKAIISLNWEELVAWNDWYDEILWGNMTEDIPELALTATNQAMDHLEAIMQTDKWWELSDSTVSSITEDLSVLFHEYAVEQVTKQSELEYEMGNTPTIINNPLTIQSKEKLYGVALEKHLQRMRDTLPGDIRKATISGIRKSLVNNASYVAKDLDTTQILQDNMCVSYVRAELQGVCNALIEEFGNDVNKLIGIGE